MGSMFFLQSSDIQHPPNHPTPPRGWNRKSCSRDVCGGLPVGSFRRKNPVEPSMPRLKVSRPLNDSLTKRRAMQRVLATLLETNELHLKMDGWNTMVSYWVSAYFQGRTVSFRECKFS